MNEAREEIDAIPPDEEVHVVQPHAQQHGILETILDHVVYLPMIVTPQPRIQEWQNIGLSSITPLQSVHRKTTKHIQVDESGLTSLEGKLPD